MSGLPKGWVEAPLSQVTTKIGSGATPKGGHTAYATSGTPLIRSQNVHFSGFTDVGLAYLDDAQARNLDSVTVRHGDVLLNITGASIGRVTLAPERMDGARVNQHVSIIRPAEGMNSAFIAGFLASPSMQQLIIAENYGVTRQALTKGMIEAIKLPVPPLPEQRRIVAKIDSLTTKSRRARDHLDHIPRLVEKYKQAILAAAFRGDLTREWRARKSADDVSPAALEELRKEAWGTFSASSRYSVADGIDWRPDIDLPPGWVWASVDQLSHLIQYGSSAKTNDDETGVAVLRMGNLQGGSLDLNSLKYLPQDHHEFPTLLLQRGDVLFNRTNSAELVGKTAVYDEEPARASFASYLIRIKTCGFVPRLLSAYINSHYGREWVASVVNQQVGQANVNGTKLRQLGVPVMPLAEQAELLHRIETAFAWIDRLAAEATSARKLIDRLDQAVLAKAFRGELVPQDPSDEPAGMLLERIRAERGAAPKPRRGRRPAAEA
ncbi:restriction endonuclease subunit S [Xanthobacter autotrophicus]|uniref:restriction endonuclease subunit S n=1 Tax=Xanthobacter TaxID=279 RepID=UPI0024ABAE94|nr:restriction endonuclease subunit S [Xanthobacter autotrophicus]MDI4662997.1 restriction endonuclease subunit S [Xanthobacter autotrophicus]